MFYCYYCKNSKVFKMFYLLVGEENVCKAIIRRCESFKTGGIYFTQAVLSRRLGYKDHEV